MTDHYDALGVSADADQATLRAAWRDAAATWHPDKFRDASAAERARAAERWERARAARDVLLEPAARAAYDASLKPPQTAPGADLRGVVRIPYAVAVRGGPYLLTVGVPDGGVRRVRLDVPPGVTRGTSWRFTCQGGAGDPPGDLVLVLDGVEPDPRWRVVGGDTHMPLRVGLADILEGAEVLCEGPRGRLAVRLPPRDLRPLRVAGHGAPGDLVINLELVWPTPDRRLVAEIRRHTATVGISAAG